MAAWACVLASGCSSSNANSTEVEGDGGRIDAEPPDTSAPEAGVSKASACASEFGNALTNSFGRVDGTVIAVVGTKDTQCALPNNDHIVIQVRMNGSVYRMVASVFSTRGDPNVGYLTKEAPLGAPGWEEGWHTDAVLDYVTSLGVHSTEFSPHPMAELESLVVSEIEVGARISVYSTSSGGDRANSSHLVHRNAAGKDGAIVVRPDTANPKYLLFRFADQSF